MNVNKDIPRVVPRPGCHLVSASAFWCNNTKGGLGIMLPVEKREYEQAIWQAMNGYSNEWNRRDPKGRQEMVAELVEQLTAWGKNRQSLNDTKISKLAFLNIWLLETVGAIQPDEFNGCLFCWEEVSQQHRTLMQHN